MHGSGRHWLIAAALLAIHAGLLAYSGYVHSPTLNEPAHLAAGISHWGRALYGGRAGLVALVLWCFSPNILAHGALISADLGATALGLAAGYLFWQWLKEPCWSRALGAGLTLGLAELTKTTWIVL